MSSSAGIAILGAGIFAKEAVLNQNAPALKAVYSRSEKSARDLATLAQDTLKLSEAPTVYHEGDKSTDLDALLKRNDINAVVVVMPITSQPGIILKALEAGKHVLSEKPVAADVAKGLDLIKEYNTRFKPKGLIWRVAENFESEPAIRLAGDAIRSGKIGDVVFFKALAVNHIDEESKWYKTSWRTVPDYQGGFLLDGGVHTIAVLRTILPDPLTHLSAFASLNKEYLKPHDTINAIAKADGKYHGTIELSWAFPTADKPPLGDQFVVTGTRGWVSINHSWPTSSVKVTIRSIKPTEGGKEEEVQEVIEKPIQGVEAELRDFFDVISGKQALPIGVPEGALFDVAVIQAALNSGGQLVDLVKLQTTG
ncbi:oxidoreductase family protein [Coprinopsis cinerea okayama7|uniref:Oxidoreductase family protein n=1 Tax=Coprinopsis cinerea (strain Okayama-7 / 130 / ATCC MYA-4618 / FGSC 9003) TaxID=240176 RepID=A8PDG4_COPC7|nr:oxidoreductase family protein [Coprinopsis cinerea okayama7\|eukprot:XP_001840594.2 oxidoreductase family protein [Coprinopsis cinerea okayama7\